MKKCRLSFAEILMLKEDLIEIIVDEGIVVNEVMVDEFHDFLLTNISAPYRILISTRNSYSYTFRAQLLIAKLKQIEAIGVSIENTGALMSFETMNFLNKNNRCNIQFELFMTRIEALAWLQGLNMAIA